MSLGKIYILDTNVLVHDPDSIFSFGKELVGIPVIALEELDRFKSEASHRGFGAREVIRHLDVLRTHGSLRDGVDLENGGKLKILFELKDQKCPFPIDMSVVDNQMLLIAYCMQKDGYEVRFITKDINARVKADVLGIRAEDYEEKSVSKEHLYRGWTTIQAPSVQLKKESPEELIELAQDGKLVPNQFITLESRNNPFNNQIYRYLGNNKFKKVVEPNLSWPIRSRNPHQLMALDLLLDDSVQLVTLVGPAGTGKTFLALLAGLHKVLIERKYEKLLISRPVIPLGRDIGYLPGTMQEKLFSWMQPIYDNMDVITHAANLAGKRGIYKDEDDKNKYSSKKFGKHKYRDKHKNIDSADHKSAMPSLDDLIEQGKFSLEAITYMRGRSIPYQYILIDEVQNLTPHEVKTLISRVGEGSKIILAGDPYQIDSPYLDFSSNGLVVSTAKFQGQQIFGTVYLDVSERSVLSHLAAELL